MAHFRTRNRNVAIAWKLGSSAVEPLLEATSNIPIVFVAAMIRSALAL